MRLSLLLIGICNPDLMEGLRIARLNKLSEKPGKPDNLVRVCNVDVSCSAFVMPLDKNLIQ